MCRIPMDIIRGLRVTNPLVLRAHIAELEELRDDLLPHAKMGQAEARDMVAKLHRVVMEKRDRLRTKGGFYT